MKMLPGRTEHNCRSVRIVLLLLLALNLEVSCHQCYVCGPSQQGFKKDCDQFNSHPELYIENCDTNHFGCSTQFQDGTTIRQCEELKINDCKMANGVKYCFCRAELCNDPKFVSTQPSDDEDMAESSGLDEMEEDATEVTTVTPRSTGTPLLHSTVMLLMASILLY